MAYQTQNYIRPFRAINTSLESGRKMTKSMVQTQNIVQWKKIENCQIDCFIKRFAVLWFKSPSTCFMSYQVLSVILTILFLGKPPGGS